MKKAVLGLSALAQPAFASGVSANGGFSGAVAMSTPAAAIYAMLLIAAIIGAAEYARRR